MKLYFNEYSTPLVFGFVQGWIYAILLWIRGRRNERLSDFLLAWLIVACCLEITDYMLGFLGVEILWRELEFFPRDISLLLGPLSYFYLKSLTNVDFRFSRKDGWHLLPFLIKTSYHLIVFSMGSQFVQHWEETVHRPFHITEFEAVLYLASNYFYLYLSLRLYQSYRQWTPTQFSDTETISFSWFRNFLIIFSLSITFSWFIYFLDLWLNLPFAQDWWSELVIAVLIYYLSISGYAQQQSTKRVAFEPELPATLPVTLPIAEPVIASPAAEPATRTHELPELALWREKLLAIMDEQKLYLDSELSLADLARRLHTNTSMLSQVINVGLGRNFNDFVNEYRINEFKKLALDESRQHLSLLGIALDAGFNSKATFNRVFKKSTGVSPKEFVDEVRAGDSVATRSSS